MTRAGRDHSKAVEASTGRGARWGFALAFMAALMWLIGVTAAWGQSDTQRPQVVSVTPQLSVIDLSTGQTTIPIEYEVRDDSSGIQSVYIYLDYSGPPIPGYRPPTVRLNSRRFGTPGQLVVSEVINSTALSQWIASGTYSIYATVTDHNGASATLPNADRPTVEIINGIPGNRAPQGQDDTTAIPAGQSAPSDITAFILANDSDPDGDAITITAFDDTGTTGAVNLAAGALSYGPNGQFQALGVNETFNDTFTYTIADPDGYTDTMKVTMQVRGDNDLPRASADAFDVNRDDGPTDLTALLLQFDHDPDTNDTLAISAVDTAGTTGLVTFSNGSVSYDPNGAFDTLTAGQSAIDTFTYTVSDGNGGTDTATVTMTVHGINTPPSTNLDVVGADYNADFPYEVSSLAPGYQLHPDAAEAAGGFWAAWADFSPSTDASVSDIRMRRFLNGNFTGPEIIVSDPGTGETFRQAIRPRIAVLTNHSVVAVWSETGATFRGIRARRLGDSGNFLDAGETTVVEGSTIGRYVAVAPLVDRTGYVVMWTRNNTGVQIQRFGNDGVALDAAPVTIAAYSDGSIANAPNLARLSDGRYILVWERRLAGSPHASDVVEGLILDIDKDASVTTYPPFLISPSGTLAGLPHVAALSQSRAAITYQDLSREIGGDASSSWDNGRDGHVRVLDPIAQTLSAPELIAQSDFSSDIRPHVTALPVSDTVMASMTRWSTSNSFLVGEIVGREFGQAGLPDGAEFVLASGTSAFNGRTIGRDDTAAPGDFSLVYTEVGNRPPGLPGATVLGRDFIPADAGPDRPDLARLAAATSYPADQTVTLDVLANDTDADGDTLSIARINGLLITEGASIVLPSRAAVSLQSGRLVYDARTAPFARALAAGVRGSDRFRYTVTDGRGGFASSTVSIILTGVNDAPTAVAVALDFAESDVARDVTAAILGAGSDVDGETLTIASIDASGTIGTVTTTALAGDAWRAPIPASAAGQSVSYDPAFRFEYLADGQVFEDQFSFTLADPSGRTATSVMTLRVTGENDDPLALPDEFSFVETDGETDITGQLLANDVEFDINDFITIVAVSAGGVEGNLSLDDGQVTYDPAGAFDDLEPGQSRSDTFSYLIADQFGGVSEAQVTITVRGIDTSDYTLSVATGGLGSGSINSPAGSLLCGSAGTNCSALVRAGTIATLSAVADSGSVFAGWSGGCLPADNPQCTITVAANTAISARFALVEPPAGRIVAATLPGARSSFVGGPAFTAYLTVLSRASSPAQACRVTAPGTPPFTLAYRRLDGTNAVTGEDNPQFDLANGGAANFLLVFTPTAVTGDSGYVFQPRILCENADLAPIEGVNSILVSIGSAPAPDILSIGVTPSSDGVVRVPASGNRVGFMSAAALNIGAGDGSAGAGQATVAVSADTGAAVLPVTLEVCETASTGGCVTPRGVDRVISVFDPNTPKFYAVFVRANEGADIPFNPANARVFLRFADGNGVTRSATSAAISSPLAAPAPAIAAGRWSVLVRQGSGDWPSLRRASLYLGDDGQALLDDGERLVSLRFEGLAIDADMARFELAGRPGQSSGASIISGDPSSNQPGALWGVRDMRGDAPAGWSELAGSYGALTLGPDGAIAGVHDGCLVHGTATTALTMQVTLTSCAASGRYAGVIDRPANDNLEPRLIIGNDHQRWQFSRSR